jgi:hypothetical protein
VRVIAVFGLVVVIAVTLFFGLHPVTPARTFDDYSLKAKDTAESVLSSVETARLASRVGSDGRAFGPYVSVLLSEADQGIGSAQSVFESIQPPDRHADVVRARLNRLLNRASDRVSRLRIAARRGEIDTLERRAEPLQAIARRLNAFIEAMTDA